MNYNIQDMRGHLEKIDGIIATMICAADELIKENLNEMKTEPEQLKLYYIRGMVDLARELGIIGISERKRYIEKAEKYYDAAQEAGAPPTDPEQLTLFT
jgi:hypothetical protein